MHTFVRKYEGFQLDGGWGRTPLFVVGWADNEPKRRKHPVAQTPRIPADDDGSASWRRGDAAGRAGLA